MKNKKSSEEICAFEVVEAWRNLDYKEALEEWDSLLSEKKR